MKNLCLSLVVLLSINAIIFAIYIITLILLYISQCRRCKTTKQDENTNQDKQKELLNSTETATIADVLKSRLNSLLTVKSIVTLILTEVFAFLTINNNDRDNMQQFMTVYTVIIAFYFGTQVQKNQDAVKSVKQDMADNSENEKQSL